MDRAVHALVIDDNPVDLQVLEKMLTMAGATYTQVQNPANLEDVLQTLEQLDVVFVDLEMPGLDGYEVFGILKNFLGDSVPLIAHTAHSNEAANAKELGFDGFLAKPVKMAEFPGLFARILNGEEVWQFK